MTLIADEFVNIDDRLRLVLFGLECAFNVEFDPKETERIFQDAKEDQISFKEYTLCHVPPLRVFGQVEEYESEEIRLFIEGPQKIVDQFRRVIELSEYHYLRMIAARDQETCN